MTEPSLSDLCHLQKHATGGSHPIVNIYPKHLRDIL